MKSVIEQLYYEKKSIRDKIKVSEKYSEVHTQYGEIIEELSEGLNDGQKQLLNSLIINVGDLEEAMACTHFKEGFKLGMLVAFEIFNN